MVTTAVEQLTLVLKQAAALGIKKQIITTGGSQNPDQLIDQAGAAANGTYHLTTFAALVSGRYAQSGRDQVFPRRMEEARLQFRRR